jgi:uncharacterized protein YyaL (SSP411 family)
MLKATALYDSILQNFYVPEDGGYWREYAPAKEGDRKTCFLWSYFAMTGMLYQSYKAGADVKIMYKKALEGFSYYRSKPIGQDKIKYHSGRGEMPNGGQGDCFFDDNIWVARNFLFAYEVFGDSEYLEEACRIVNYVYTGWNEEIGGLVWNENGLTEQGTEQELERGLSANACCIIVNALLYQITGKEDYLSWAKKFYQFCKTVQDSETKIYYNGVHTLLVDGKRVAGKVNRDLYSYNAGSMILADLLLYEITKDQSFYTDAFDSAKAAHEAFLRHDDKSGLSYYRDFDWFIAILVEAYISLAAYDKAFVEPFGKVLSESIECAADRYTSPIGLLPHDYVLGWRDNDDYDRMLLTQSGTAEIAFLLELLKQH